jgi:aminoglycoside phosphotransferase (APT) family kinase protein
VQNQADGSLNVMTDPNNPPFEQLVRKIDPQSRLMRTWALTGGVSAQVTGLEIQRADGQTTKMIVRQHGAIDLQHNPQIAADEFKLLSILHSAGLATPEPVMVDESGEIFETPVIVMEFVEGITEFAPDEPLDRVRQMAEQLVQIHTLDAKTHDLAFLPQQEIRAGNMLRNRPAVLDESLDEGHIRDVLDHVWPLAQRNSTVLLHGDYWPGNILWHDGRLAAVIDWEDAAVGDALADVGNARLEILWAFGLEAMQAFTDQYRALSAIDFAHLPSWDLVAALRPAHKLGTWGLDAAIEARMREYHRAFVRHAIG